MKLLKLASPYQLYIKRDNLLVEGKRRGDHEITSTGSPSQKPGQNWTGAGLIAPV